jgi:subtilisin family serine protease
LAGPGGAGTPQFVQIPGVQEFTGRMIARPLQLGELLRRQVSPIEASRMRAQARRAVAAIALEYVAATDEYIIRVPKGSNENKLASELMATGNFQYVEPDWRVFPIVTTPNDPLYPQQWHLPKIRANFAWDHFTGNNSVTVALCDTGVRLDHEDLAPLLVPGYNSASGVPQASGGQVNDINGHGTHTAGTAAAMGNNALGVSGVGWSFRIMPIRVTNSTGGSASITSLTNGARWAADNGARVISTSYSGVSSSSVQTTGNYIKTQRNGIYLWAAGNSNTNLSTFDHLDVTIVGATDQNDAKASFSSYGRAVDVFAPGVSIVATYYSASNSYASMSGTSMATPCAAGVAALIMATNPSLTGAQVETVLYRTCFDLGVPGEDEYWGWGRVDAYAGLLDAYTNFPFGPTSFQVFNASVTSGGVPQLRFGDDDRLVLTAPVNSGADIVSPVIEMESFATNNLFQTLEFVYEGHVSMNGVQQKIELYDFSVGAWVEVDRRLATTSDQTITLTPSSPTRFRQILTGRVRARVTYEIVAADLAFGTWQMRIDRATWRTAP